MEESKWGGAISTVLVYLGTGEDARGVFMTWFHMMFSSYPHIWSLGLSELEENYKKPSATQVHVRNQQKLLAT